MLNVANKPIMLSIDMLDVVMPSLVEPWGDHLLFFGQRKKTFFNFFEKNSEEEMFSGSEDRGQFYKSFFICKI
jgi:hypothetical protein